ncbi:MAG: 16S rRNA (guanine(966)-N(2))-methyltransferase RsmD [Caldiserica bacterium]|nr:MAG: 16S rRNA (guanine(966)-N(2))-methyltransferase RsmD [Caldisericota bacterium]
MKAGITVIAGKFKGRKISSLKQPILRPLLARARKSMFDILGSFIIGKSFLDLYAGVGTVGIEALSRGAKEVHFVECNRKVLKVLRKNIEHLNQEKKVKIFEMRVEDFVRFFERSYDVIFLGPPYKDGIDVGIVERLEGFLSKNSVIILQHSILQKLPLKIGERLCLKRKRIYGKTVLSFYSF